MSGTRHATDNPYWDDYLKPHIFDLEEVKGLCRSAAEIVLSSIGVSALWVDDLDEEPDWEFPLLIELHQRSAETRLSKTMLSLAVSFRALDDLWRKDKEYKALMAKLHTDVGGSFLFVYEGLNINTNLREACNKIIHAEDLRCVYDNGSAPRDEGVWHMQGTLELKGNHNGSIWSVSLEIFQFLEAMLEVAYFLYSSSDISERSPTEDE